MVLVNSHRVEGKAKYQDIGITNLLASIFFLASFTLPMLPAPIVLPNIHFPDWVGIVVRDRDCLVEEEC